MTKNNDWPPNIDPEIKKDGNQVCIVNYKGTGETEQSWALERWVQSVAQASNARVDWSTMWMSGPPSRVLCLGDAEVRQRVRETIQSLEHELPEGMTLEMEEERPPHPDGIAVAHQVGDDLALEDPTVDGLRNALKNKNND